MDEETLIARANEEREKLFQRYDRGREPGAEIDAWEDPGFEVYHQTDRYGFIHDKRLPQRSDPNESKANAIEMERVKKWLKMLKRWDSKDTHEKLRKRVYKGIPDKLRSRVWVKLLDLEKTMIENKDVYPRMLKLARQWSTEARQIDSDVNRQFREHLFYRERYSIKQKSLFNVLTAYSMYNMEVGYCQGMSGLAGVLLMYMDEEEAFWALSTLLADRKFAMHGLYIEGFPKLTRFLAHHDKIITKFIPKLKKHFDQYNLDSILYSLKWFFVVFVERIPFNLCLRVWDIYLLDGERVVTAMAYTILKLHKNKILKLRDMDLIVQYMQVKLHKDFGFDDDHVIKALENSLEELRKAKLDLPPPGADIEFPKRPFGVFQEPSFEAKIGRRKSIFTETEKEVTDTVILSREKTAQDLAESALSNGGCEIGSNAQLNTGARVLATLNCCLNTNFTTTTIRKRSTSTSFLTRTQKNDGYYCMSSITHNTNVNRRRSLFLPAGTVPESEDGCSLLGSSRKSLADTSVTSTADLSIFSGGQRSQQAYDICVDDARSVHSDGEGESSPGSAFCSLSVVGRTPSAMMITPTPRAMSPHDIVRIYVPPAPPEEMANQKNVNETRMSSNESSKRESVISGGGGGHGSDGSGNTNGEVTPIRNSLYKSEEELRSLTETIGNGVNGSNGGGYGHVESSSSRRASMSRKSPAVFDNPELIECSHVRSRKTSLNDSVSNTIKLNVNVSGGGGDSLEKSRDSVERKIIMTSFEELAKSKMVMKNDRRATKSEHYGTDDDYDSDVKSTSYYSTYSTRIIDKSKTSNDCSVQYKALSSSVGSDSDYLEGRTTHRSRIGSNGGGGGINSGNEDSPVEYDPLVGTHSSRVRNESNHYNRFFDENHRRPTSHCDDDETDDDDIQFNKSRNKSSDDSSSSPLAGESKSALATPINETIPLLLSSPTSNYHPHHPISPTTTSYSTSSSIVKQQQQNNFNLTYHNNSFDNRIAAPLGGVYEYTSTASFAGTSSDVSGGISNNSSNSNNYGLTQSSTLSQRPQTLKSPTSPTSYQMSSNSNRHGIPNSNSSNLETNKIRIKINHQMAAGHDN